MNTNQILIQQYINSLGTTNQWMISNRNNKTTIVNLYSLDQFLPFRFIQSNHGKLFQQFKLRNLYTLPHTPKIILLPNILKTNSEILLLAQRGQFQFHKLITKCHGNYKTQLELILQILQTVVMLQKKYGYFKLTQGMVRASKGPSLLIWINEDQTTNYPQFPIGPLYPVNLQKVPEKDLQQDKIKDNQMYIMVMSILQVLSEKMPNNLTINELIKEKPQNLNFSFIKKKIYNAIRNENSEPYSIQSNVSIEKYKTFTQQKKKKMPQFLLNKCNYSNKKKQKQKNNEANGNQKSILNFLKNKNNNNNINNESNNKKNIDKKLFKDKTDKFKYFFHQKIINQSKTLFLNQNSLTTHTYLHSDLFSTDTPSNRPKQKIIKLKKDQKPPVRDSGKTSSTTSAHYLSINSSGKKFFQNNFSVDISQSSDSTIPLKTSEKKIDTFFSKNTHKNQQQPKSLFHKQNTNKLQIKISKIIQQNTQQHNNTSLKNYKSNPLNTINKSSLSITQKSIISPDSEFYNDVDILLHSAVLSQNHISDELNKSLEQEFQKILFD